VSATVDTVRPAFFVSQAGERGGVKWIERRLVGYRIPESAEDGTNDREPGIQKRTGGVEDDPRKLQQTEGYHLLNAFDDTCRFHETCRLLRSGGRSLDDSTTARVEHERVER